MSLKKCEKCGEDVDVAKAFCPECGNPFVEEEKREEVNEFEKQAGTVVFSKTAYNVMLGKMDLDTSRSPEAEENWQNPIQNPANNFPPQNKTPDQSKKSVGMKWIIIGAIAALIFFFIVAVILIALYIFFYK